MSIPERARPPPAFPQVRGLVRLSQHSVRPEGFEPPTF